MRKCRLVSTLIALVILARSGAAQSTAESRQVDVDGHAMHLSIAGDGPITIVLEAGGGWSLRQWDLVQPKLAPFARVVSYDRPGLGKSVQCSKAETAHRVATELHAALESAGLRPPYLFVAHSMGGLFARVFTSMFPSEVGGLVLLDPAPELFYDRVRRELPELYAMLEQAPDAPKGAARAAADTTLAQAAASDPLPPIPIVLFTRSKWDGAPPEMARIWTQEHQRWVARTPTAKLRVAENSGHDIPRDEPQVVVDAVRDMLRQLDRRVR
jgi:pimeloyl-ACP methyl ester carboxylesterase